MHLNQLLVLRIYYHLLKGHGNLKYWLQQVNNRIDLINSQTIDSLQDNDFYLIFKFSADYKDKASNDIDCFIQQLLKQSLKKSPRHAINFNKSFIKNLCHNAIRWHFRNQEIISYLIDKPIKERNFLFKALLLLSLTELIYLKTPDFAVLDKYHYLADNLNLTHFKKLLNYCLRTYLANSKEIIAKLQINYASRYSVPEFFIDELKQNKKEFLANGYSYQQILSACKQEPKLYLRINVSKISADSYLEKLQAIKGINAVYAISAKFPLLQINGKNINIKQLPYYQQGFFSVQDKSAFFCGELVNNLIREQNFIKLWSLRDGGKLVILDACAAPGGKASHLIEALTQNKIKYRITANDINAKRLKLMQQNFDRLGMLSKNLQLTCYDFAEIFAFPKQFQQKYNLIILDTPCSASGLIKRQPDVLLKDFTTILPNIKNLQQQLLKNLWLALQPSGYLIYITCSLFSSENLQQITKFLVAHDDAKLIDITQYIPPSYLFYPSGLSLSLMLSEKQDGFYYAVLQKLDNS